eukprot:scaffold108827_cov46-Prasinocladus_malaysianus.AAC.8
MAQRISYSSIPAAKRGRHYLEIRWIHCKSGGVAWEQIPAIGYISIMQFECMLNGIIWSNLPTV